VDAQRRLEHYDWPGNVRELKQVIDAAVALANGPRITSADLENIVRDKRGDGRASFELSFIDRRMLAVLDENGWRVADAARELGVTPRSVYRRLKRLGVKSPEGAQAARMTRAPVTVPDVTTKA
jgi:transcriptional regulator of acetoin/glycerol metabolism